METTSEPGRVQLSEAAAGALKRLDCPDFGVVSRGERMIKGKVGDAAAFLFFRSSQDPVYNYLNSLD